MTIAAEIQSLSPSAVVEFYEFDTTPIGGTDVFRFHAGTNQLNQPVVWQGVTYTPWPVQAEGFDVSGKGVLPRPSMKVANIDGLLSAEILSQDDLVGAKVTRKRTFVRYLDPVNFPSGNPTADPNQYLPDDVWFVERKVNENRHFVEFELASAFDLQGVMLPCRQVVHSCMWKYRGPECGYSALVFYDKNDLPTSNPALDVCGKRLNSCKVRFGVENALPFGGFPGALRYE